MAFWRSEKRLATMKKFQDVYAEQCTHVCEKDEQGRCTDFFNPPLPGTTTMSSLDSDDDGEDDDDEEEEEEEEQEEGEQEEEEQEEEEQEEEHEQEEEPQVLRCGVCACLHVLCWCSS